MNYLNEIQTTAPESFNKDSTKKETKQLLKKLYNLQNLLYAESKYSVLIILQGMDASGKDGAIRKVLGRMNPQGVSVTSFKVPTEAELAHDFLWRIHEHAPAKGMIKVFNRSHYEDVLITRVMGWCDDEMAQQRFVAINDFEKLLTVHNNTIIFKFYLHLSKTEQQERLAERIDDPQKQWKYNAEDFEKAKSWDVYMAMYEDVFKYCSYIPWTVIPTDQNWYKEYLIAKTIVEKLETLDMKYPSLKKSDLV